MANQTLLDAAKIIEEKGWTKGAYHDDQGYCAIGALNKACGFYNDVNREAYNIAIRCLAKYLKLPTISSVEIIRYNDRVAKNADEVINAMRAAAEAC